MSTSEFHSPQAWAAEAWLTTHGWYRTNPGGSRIALWSRSQDEVAVPLSNERNDSPLRWGELLTRLGAIHRRSPHQIRDEIIHYGADVCEWGISHPGIDHSIPISTLHALTGTVRTSIIASANATISPRGHFGHSVPKKARDAAEAARAGHTRQGSYVIPIISMLPPPPQARAGVLDFQVTLQPFARQVMTTMARSLAKLHDLATEYVASEPLLSQVNSGVAVGLSHELCSAIANSLEDPGVEALSVSFSWAASTPSQSTAPEVVFPATLGPSVRRIADSLRGSEIVSEQTVLGSVRHTGRLDDEIGYAVVRANLGGAERSVRMTLNDENFHLATTALDERKPIVVRGVIERRRGTIWLLNEVTEFGIVEQLQLEELERHFQNH